MKSGITALPALFLITLGTLTPAETTQVAEFNDLRTQLEALKEEQARSLQRIESLEKRIDAIEKAQHPPVAYTQVIPGTQAQVTPITTAPQLQQRDLFSQDRTAAARIDNVPLDPDMTGFFRLGNTPTMLRLGGYAKADFIHDFKLPGNPDMFVTSSFPLEPAASSNSSNIHIRQSRISAEIRRQADFGNLRAYFEGDFFGAGPTIFNLRHLYGQVHNFLVGWSFSAFMDIDSFPDTVDFEGPGGGVFLRQPEVRYTWPLTKANSVAFSVEKPTTDILVTNPNYPNIQLATPTSPIPDFVVRYRYEDPRGHVQLGTVLRSVGGAAQVPGTTSFVTAHTFGWGLNLSGAWQTYGKDSILFQLAYGRGIGRYIEDLVGLGADASLNASKHLEATPALGTFFAYQHYWKKPNWRSTATYGYAEVQNQAAHPATFYHKTNYLSGNVIWNPVGSLNIGAEYMYGNLTVKDGSRGFGSRMQLSVQYDLFKWAREAK